MILKLKRTPGIYLVGFMGCGKSTRRLGRSPTNSAGASSDLDRRNRKRRRLQHQRNFPTQQGEPVFRALEASALAKRVNAVKSGRPQVIALGGGALMDDKNFELILNPRRSRCGSTPPSICIEKANSRRVPSPSSPRPQKASPVVRRALPTLRPSRLSRRSPRRRTPRHSPPYSRTTVILIMAQRDQPVNS